MRHFAKWMALSLIAVLLLSACSGGKSTTSAPTGEKKDPQVTIRAMMEPHPSTTALKKLAPEFERETGIKVVLEEVPYENLPEKALLTFNSKSADYDIVHDDWLFHGYGYAKAGYLEPLDAYVSNKDLNKYADYNDFLTGLVDQHKVDGKLYGLPLYTDSTFLMYRKDLFEAAGLKVPETMEEMLAAVQKLHNPPQMYGITLRGRRGIHMAWLWGNFLKAFGGDYIDASGKPVLDQKGAMDAAKFYLELMKYAPADASNYGWEENRLAFEQGRAAMTIDASVNAGFAEDAAKSKIAGKVGYALIPKGPGGYGINISAHSLYISKFSKNKEAAYKFIAWATSKEVQAKAMALEPNASLTSMTVLNSKPYQDAFGKFAKVHMDSVAKGNMDYIPKLPQATEITDTLSTYLSQSLTEKKPVEQAMKEANDAIAKILKK